MNIVQRQVDEQAELSKKLSTFLSNNNPTGMDKLVLNKWHTNISKVAATLPTLLQELNVKIERVNSGLLRSQEITEKFINTPEDKIKQDSLMVSAGYQVEKKERALKKEAKSKLKS